ncbi:hypothetical protein [Streptomyces sp. NPDC005438]|uniref:hypothetical protein n=1 Tax=Streptomyces sp. NPDC005438 TaxID=3156880 RepID=UPI00339E788F
MPKPYPEKFRQDVVRVARNHDPGVTWIERTYHRRRRQAALGQLTLVEYETVMTTPALQAA